VNRVDVGKEFEHNEFLESIAKETEIAEVLPRKILVPAANQFYKETKIHTPCAFGVLRADHFFRVTVV
jgi:hypothetical protein